MAQQTIFNKPAELDEFYNRVMRIADAMCGTASRQTSALSFPSAMVASPRFEDAPALRVKMPNGFQVDFAPSNPLSIGKSLSVTATGTLGQERKSSVENAPSSPLKSPRAAAIASRTWLSDWVNFR